MNTTWTPTRYTSNVESQLILTGSLDDVVAELELRGYTPGNGFEIEAMTDQIDVYRVTRSGRRVRFTLMP